MAQGFEATGKADAYDDRIFALSTVLSAVLVYNLPETVRESDMQVRAPLPPCCRNAHNVLPLAAFAFHDKLLCLHLESTSSCHLKLIPKNRKHPIPTPSP